MSIETQYRRAAVAGSYDPPLEFDDDATVIPCDEGAYVQCWTWVPASALPVPPPPTLDELRLATDDDFLI